MTRTNAAEAVQAERGALPPLPGGARPRGTRDATPRVARSPGRPRNAVCPPSSAKVLAVLDAARAPLSPKEIQERTGLGRRTMYVALDCVQRLGLVRAGISLRDARQRRYILNAESADGQWWPCYERGDC